MIHTDIGELMIHRKFLNVPFLNTYPLLTRKLLLAHDVILAFALQALHDVVNNAKFSVVETNPTSAFLGDFPVNIDQLIDSKSLFGGVSLSFSSSQSCFITALFSFNVCLHNTCESP